AAKNSKNSEKSTDSAHTSRRCGASAPPSPISCRRLLRRLGARGGIRQHSERALIEVEEALLLVVLVLVHFADLDQLAHDFRIEAGAFGLGVDFLDVFAECALFVLEPLDALDQRFELLTRNAAEIGHCSPSSPLQCRPPAAAPTIAAPSSRINASARRRRRPSARRWLPSGILPATRRRACHRRSRAIRDRTARGRGPRLRRGTISTGS